MIIYPAGSPLVAEGHHEPVRRQINHLRRNADDSFYTHLDLAKYPRFMDNVPRLPEGLHLDEQTPMILKIRNVEPHTDQWVGTGSEPKERLALFWVLWIKHHCYFGVSGAPAVCLKSGDFVIFDDSKEHYVISSTIWVGTSWQLRRSLCLVP